jgi:hypothetical protein
VHTINEYYFSENKCIKLTAIGKAGTLHNTEERNQLYEKKKYIL